MNRKITIAIAGLGSRGKDAYAPAIARMSDRAEIVAVADIDFAKVQKAAQIYHVPEERCFNSAESLLAENRLADVLVLATQDRQHVQQAIPALEKGYDLLLEKPISPNIEECKQLLEVSKRTGRKVVVCHVLRYTPFFEKAKQILDSGVIGDIVSIMAIENVGYWHQAHSFVRGNWSNSSTTSPMILQKCCHDMDLYIWLSGKRCRSVSSYGGLYWFKPEHAPMGAALRCLDNCKAKDNCPFDAEKIYIKNKATGIEYGNSGWPNDVLCMNPTKDRIYDELRTGPYGRCVYHCENNVVDHQVVNLEMTDKTTMSFTMCGFTQENSRYAKLMGTKGEMHMDMSKRIISVTPFGQASTEYEIEPSSSGHSGGDEGIIRDFLDYISDDHREMPNITSLERSIESHMIALAAERSRLSDGECVLL